MRGPRELESVGGAQDEGLARNQPGFCSAMMEWEEASSRGWRRLPAALEVPFVLAKPRSDTTPSPEKVGSSFPPPPPLVRSFSGSKKNVSAGEEVAASRTSPPRPRPSSCSLFESFLSWFPRDACTALGGSPLFGQTRTTIPKNRGRAEMERRRPVGRGRRHQTPRLRGIRRVFASVLPSRPSAYDVTLSDESATEDQYFMWALIGMAN